MRSVAIWKRAWLPYSETFIRDQINALPDWSVVRLGFHNLNAGILEADYAPYRDARISKLTRNLFGIRPYRSSFESILEKSNAELIHAHFGTGGLEAMPLARASRLPLITTFHGSDTSVRWPKFEPMNALYRLQLQTLFRRSSKLIAVSKYLADQLIRAGAPQDKVEVLYTGIRPAAKLPALDPNGVIFVGRLVAIKGVDHVLRAIAECNSRLGLSVPFTIVGDGPLRDELELLARSLNVNATFTGRLPSSEIPQLLAQHKVFCAPSLPSPSGTREGFGMVHLEAAMQELPSVAYDSGGTREAVEDGTTGLLAPEGNYVELARHLEKLLVSERLQEDLGCQARLRVLDSFNLEKQSQHLSALYTEALS